PCGTLDAQAGCQRRSGGKAGLFLYRLVRVCSRFVRSRAVACFCARQGTRSAVWSFQISDEKRRIAQKQARPEGLGGKWRQTALRDLARVHHCLRPAPCLAPLGAATQLATKREQTLGFIAGRGRSITNRRGNENLPTAELGRCPGRHRKITSDRPETSRHVNPQQMY